MHLCASKAAAPRSNTWKIRTICILVEISMLIKTQIKWRVISGASSDNLAAQTINEGDGTLTKRAHNSLTFPSQLSVEVRDKHHLSECKMASSHTLRVNKKKKKGKWNRSIILCAVTHSAPPPPTPRRRPSLSALLMINGTDVSFLDRVHAANHASIIRPALHSIHLAERREGGGGGWIKHLTACRMWDFFFFPTPLPTFPFESKHQKQFTAPAGAAATTFTCFYCVGGLSYLKIGAVWSNWLVQNGATPPLIVWVWGYVPRFHYFDIYARALVAVWMLSAR